jgi:uncharacterized protein
MRSIISVAIITGVGFIACTDRNSSTVQTQKADDMKNIVSIVEIPTTDFSRAVGFYQTILNVRIEETDMGGVQMGIFPGDGETVNVALVKGDDYKPTTNGTIVYLNAGDDLQIILDRIEPNGGKVVVPKTEISPEMGFFAMFTDTEGNKVGLHSGR